MELLGYTGQVEAHFSLFRDSVNLDGRQVHGLRQMHYRLRNHIRFTRWYSDVTWVKWILVSVQLETVLARRKIGAWFAPNTPLAQKSVWMHLMVLLGVVGEVEARFSPFRGSVNLDAR